MSCKICLQPLHVIRLSKLSAHILHLPQVVHAQNQHNTRTAHGAESNVYSFAHATRGRCCKPFAVMTILLIFNPRMIIWFKI